jgi:hypothetical protein
MTKWMYSGPSCLDHPFSEELGDTEINTQIRMVLAHGAILNLGTGPSSLREGVDSTWVSLLGHTLGYLCQFQFLSVFVFMRRVLGAFAAPRGGSPYLRTRQGWRPIMPTVNSCRYGGKGDGPGLQSGRR